jgi:hypothetical protein
LVLTRSEAGANRCQTFLLKKRVNFYVRGIGWFKGACN